MLAYWRSGTRGPLVDRYVQGRPAELSACYRNEAGVLLGMYLSINIDNYIIAPVCHCESSGMLLRRVLVASKFTGGW